jgi:general secretion pathway protein I
VQAKHRLPDDVGRADGFDRVATGPSSQRGYTLIEVIAAFAVLAVGLTLLLGTLSGASQQVRWAGEAGRAALHAQSLLDQTGVGQALQAGTRSGEFEDGRYRWTLDVQAWRDPSKPEGQPESLSAPQLLQLTLEVRWREGGPRERLRLTSLRLVQPGATGGVLMP